MSRFGKLLQHLRLFFRPPNLSIQTDHLKVWARQPKRSALPPRHRLRDFLQVLSLLFQSPKKKPADLKKPSLEIWKQISFLMKKSKVKQTDPAAHSKKLLLRALKQPPRVSPKELRNGIRQRVREIRTIVTRTPKAPVDPEAVRRNMRMFTQSFRKDSGILADRISIYASRLAVALRPHKKAILISFLALPLIFELFLHVTSLMTWCLIDLKTRLYPSRKEVVLFIGDSYTSGKFVSYDIPPYTDFLKDQPGLKIVDFSNEYMNSNDVLRELPKLLQIHRPALIYLMVGINDFLEQYNSETTLPKIEDQEADAVVPWFRTGLFFRSIQVNGLSSGLVETFTVRPAFIPAPAVDSQEVITDSSFFRLLRSSSSDTSSLSRERVPAADLELRSDAWSYLQSGALHEAAAAFHEAERLDPHDPFPHAGLADVLYRMGLLQEVRKEASWLESKYETDPGIKTARALLYAFPFVNSNHETWILSFKLLQEYPENPWFWETFSWYAFLQGHSDMAVLSIDRAIQLTSDELVRSKASFLRTRARIVCASDPENALRNLIEAFLMDEDENTFVAFLLRDGLQYSLLDIEQCLRDISMTEENGQRIRVLFQTAINEQLIRSLALLETRLKNIASLCTQYGTQVVFVTYPVPYPQIHGLTRKVAEETGTSWLNITERFETELRNDDQQKIMKHGRLTENATRLIADWIAEDLDYRHPF